MPERELQGAQSVEELRRKVASWRSEGFEVDRLTSLLDSGAPEARHAVETAERGIEKLRELQEEFRGLEGMIGGEQAERVRRMLRNPWLAAEAESALMELQVQTEKRRKEAERRKREEERRRGELRSRMERWRAEGYEVSSLQEALGGDLELAERAARQIEEGIGRLKVCEEELSALETSGFDAERSEVEALLHAPTRAQEAEEALLRLRLKIEKHRREQQLKSERERRVMERALEKVRAWSSEGFQLPLDEARINATDTQTLLKTIEEYERAIARAKELLEELNQIKEKEFEGEIGLVRKMLLNPERLHAGEEKLVRLQLKVQRLRREREKRAEESRRWRAELQTKIAELEERGYDVTRLKEAMGRDDEALKREWVMFRIQLRRMQDLEAELRALPREGVEETVEKLLAKTRTIDVATIAEVEAGIIAVRSRLEAKKEELLRIKEEEKKEKQRIVEKLLGWVEEGYRYGIEGWLDKVTAGDIESVKEEFRRVESALRKLEALRKSLEELDATGFEAEVEQLKEMSWDISKQDEVEARVSELREKIRRAEEERQRKAEEERRRRRELVEKLEEWRRMGFDVSALDPFRDGDIEVLRKEMAVLGMRIQRAQELQGEIRAMDTSELREEAERVERATFDLNRLSEAEAGVERLRQLVTQKMSVKRRRAELRKRMEEWRSQGYDVSTLEGVIEGDIETAKKEFLIFKIKVQKLKELEEELRSIDTSGFEEEARAIEAMLKDTERVGEARDRLSELELNIGKRRAEAVRAQEERRRLKQELMVKMTGWLDEGFHVEPLEESLGKSVEEIGAAFRKFEEAVSTARTLRKELEALDRPGFREQVNRIREMLRDISELPEAQREIAELREKIARRERRERELRDAEELQRIAMVEQIEAWRQAGHNVEHLEALAGARIEELRKAVMAFRVKLERGRDIERILDHFDSPEFREEVDNVRRLARNPETLDQAEKAVAALRERIRERHQAELRRREEARKERELLADKVAAWISEGYHGQRMEELLDLPFDRLAEECKKVEACIERLKNVERMAAKMGIDPTSVPILSRLRDLDALPALEEWLRREESRRGARKEVGTEDREDMECGRHLIDEALVEGPQVTRREASLDPEKIVELRERLEQWKREGHDVSILEDYLNSGTITAEGVFQRLKALNIQMKRRREAEPDSGEAPETGPGGETTEGAERAEGREGRGAEEKGGGEGARRPTDSAPNGPRRLKKVKKVVK